MNAKTPLPRAEMTPEAFNGRCVGHFPGLVGMRIVAVSPEGVDSELALRPELLAPNGYLHAATVIALADTSCGYGCMAFLPQGASGFTTVELKANYLGTALEGILRCRATPVHLGRTTQVWDAMVSVAGAAKPIALFRCTQLVLWPK